MQIIMIKPHHFIDIIKLYGKGIEVFVPDVKMGHDFYRIANLIIQNPEIKLQLTINGDDICLPCLKYHHSCTDSINHIQGMTSKNAYNMMLDQRIIQLFSLTKTDYSAKELCQIIYQNHEYIFEVWKEEDNKISHIRHDLFLKGAQKYLKHSW